MKNIPFNIIKENNVGILNIEGIIGEDFWDEGTSKERVKAELQNIKTSGIESLTININSLGGDTNHALSIYDMIDELEIPTKAIYHGMNASSATLIGAAADEIVISENAFYLIHQPWTMSVSNLNEAKDQVEFLEKMTDRIKEIYSKRVDGNIVDDLIEVNNGNGKWITAKETVDYGFADRTLQDEAEPIMNSAVKVQLEEIGLPVLPGVPKATVETKTMIDKIKDKIFGKTNDEVEVEDEDIEKYITPISLHEEMDIRITTLENKIKEMEELKTEIVDSTEEIKVEDTLPEVVEEPVDVVEDTDTDVVEEDDTVKRITELEELIKSIKDENEKLKETVNNLEKQPLAPSINNSVNVDETVEKTAAQNRAELMKNWSNYKK